jgi:propionyl-CoA synthetase
MNTCYNCVDRHIIDGYGEQNAIIYDSPVTNTIRKITYNELSAEINTFAGLLVESGITKVGASLLNFFFVSFIHMQIYFTS